MKTFYLTLTAIILSTMSFSQVQYYADDFAEPGASALVSSAGAIQIAGMNFMDTGEDFTWQYLGLDAENQSYNNYLSPDMNGFKESFILLCIANGGNLLGCLDTWNDLAYISQTENDTLNLGGVSIASLTTIYDKTDEALVQTMTAGLIGTDDGFLPVVIELEDHDTILSFPIEYGQTFTSHGRYVIDLTQLGEDFKYTSDRTTVTTVDGYGALELPWKTYNSVLRLKKETVVNDTLIVNGTILENPLNNEVTYQWFDTGEEMAVMEVSGYKIFGGLEVYTNAGYLDTVRCLQPSALFFTSPIFPALNPETGESLVAFNNMSSNATDWEWDFGDPESGSSNYSTEMNPEHVYYSEGTYTVSLTATNNSCTPAKTDFIAIPVVVSDTVSTDISENSPEGINLSPNPFQGSFSISNMNQFDMNYRIISVSGSVVLQGISEAGSKEFITLGACEPGLYQVQFYYQEKKRGCITIIKTR
jgi:hypothetical protein